MIEPRTILQIMPAGDWCALYTDNEPPYYLIEPLAGWALYKDRDGDTAVAGLDAAEWIGFADEAGNFWYYITRQEFEQKRAEIEGRAHKRVEQQ